jgi:hypothetical protein
MLTALFGIDDGGLNLAVNLLILVLVVIWLALIYWTYADAKRRISDSVLVTTATAASLFPFIGTIVYTILRPPEFLEDARERELETKAAELRLRRLTQSSCPRCEHPVELSWLRCPECQHRLKDPCTSCGRPVDPRWAVCPYCESPVARRRSGGAPGEGGKRRAQAPKRQSGARRSESGQRRSESGQPRQQPKRRVSADGKKTTSQQSSPDKSQSPARSSSEGRPASERPTRRRPTKT